MRADPKPLRRPLLILDGYLVPGIVSQDLKRRLRRLTGDRRILALSFLFHYRFESCRRKVIAAVDRRFPTDDPVWTSEMDVVGYSMGGLIGRYAAASVEPVRQHRRLRIARLFTIATPHRGADRAALPSLTRLQRDMRAGSHFLAQLVEAAKEHPYPIHPYVRERDRIVGEGNAAPEGAEARTVSARPPEPSHMFAFRDLRIVADIARRLRGEA